MKHFVVNLSKAVLLVLLAALLCACEREAQPFSPTLSVHFLDVGEGDSIFIELPEHKAMLVDAGDSYLGLDITEYIQKAGYRKIDYLVATHPHADHIGSMSYIVRHMPVGDVYMPRVSEDSVPFRNLLSALKEQGLTVKEGKAGVNILHSGETSVDILAPESIDEEDEIYADEERMTLTLRGRTLTLGSPLKVILREADPSSRRITFGVVRDEEE